ncbi:MAG: transglutaminase family protein [SAR324 cluster bacterium]|nr:transglutaminase family protein [SAR324 cluster bacterium]
MPELNEDFKQYLSPTPLLDCDHHEVINYANRVTHNTSSQEEKAIALYYAVRDDIFYDPYRVSLAPEDLKASVTLERKFGFCVSKAILLAAALRVLGIPSRLGYADVRNHITTERMKEKYIESDLFVYHGYTDVFLNHRWVKATPAFNLSLCEKFHIKALEFDGKTDSIFHEYDEGGNKHMEYVNDHGTYADVPLDDIRAAFYREYPNLMAQAAQPEGSFEEEAKPI